MRLNNVDALFGQAIEHHLGGLLADALSFCDAVRRLNPGATASAGTIASRPNKAVAP
jgi:hypothetical protein